jgi:hypothetical protein
MLPVERVAACFLSCNKFRAALVEYRAYLRMAVISDV